MRRIAPLFLFAAGLAAAQDFAAKADEYAGGWFKRGEFMGSVLVAHEGKPLFAKGYGWANAEWEIPNAADTKFRLGSITKQFTAVAILQLVEKGKLSLDDPVSKFFDAPPAWSAINVRHLLNHTSGIPSYTGLPGFMETGVWAPKTPSEIVNMSRALPLEFKPGEKMKYNNTGYVFLGQILEKVTGSSYAEHVRKHVFEPAGMTDTGYDTHREVIKHRASGYGGSVGKLRNSRYLDMSLPHAAGALYSTVQDLLEWDQALYGDKLVSKASRDLMFTPGLNKYGFGWVIDEFEGHKRFQHGGGIFGFNTMIGRYPDDKLVVIVLGNLEGQAPFKIADGLAKLWFDSRRCR